jgi:hypothetical protein
MAHKKSLEALNRTLKGLRGNEQLFGGALWWRGALPKSSVAQ